MQYHISAKQASQPSPAKTSKKKNPHAWIATQQIAPNSNKTRNSKSSSKSNVEVELLYTKRWVKQWRGCLSTYVHRGPPNARFSHKNGHGQASDIAKRTPRANKREKKRESTRADRRATRARPTETRKGGENGGRGGCGRRGPLTRSLRGVGAVPVHRRLGVCHRRAVE